MATYSQVIVGLEILAAHEDEGTEAHIGGADHDIIYAGLCGEPLKPSEDSPTGKRLKELGWHVDSETEGWARFV